MDRSGQPGEKVEKSWLVTVAGTDGRHTLGAPPAPPGHTKGRTEGRGGPGNVEQAR